MLSLLLAPPHASSAAPAHLRAARFGGCAAKGRPGWAPTGGGGRCDTAWSMGISPNFLLQRQGREACVTTRCQGGQAGGLQPLNDWACIERMNGNLKERRSSALTSTRACPGAVHHSGDSQNPPLLVLLGFEVEQDVGGGGRRLRQPVEADGALWVLAAGRRRILGLNLQRGGVGRGGGGGCWEVGEGGKQATKPAGVRHALGMCCCATWVTMLDSTAWLRPLPAPPCLRRPVAACVCGWCPPARPQRAARAGA